MPPKKNNDKDKKQHIQVVVRCRPLSTTEERQGAYSIVKVNGQKKEISIKERLSLNAPLKTFTFDNVFGPQSTQLEVYNSTVKPIIDEALKGYNCTIFAYGQTGSGKTYTMEGLREEGSTNLSWEYDPLAGIVPRAMTQIFFKLGEMEVEHMVRVSYLEIYNEELIDLLASDSDEKPRLKIYDDVTKKGSHVITGLEDLPVQNKSEVYQILERGSQRRQTAATKMNAHSSRSHSLFMVSIHMKDTSLEGDEMLKVGKLNFVDLAGSECIGRSGAVELRAREAGSINQSLLTLGRVITALVEHAPHVPYRESKLTRLLRDSLGGHTKTSIIATISPASSNLEETLSTLEYASRAKNITNKPEINQKLSKKAVLKEYTEQIEKLKKELQAAREKCGVYLPNETYEEMTLRLQKQQETIKDFEDHISCLCNEITKLQEVFRKTKEELEDKTKKLDETSKSLSEQKFLVQQQIKTETMLYEQASQLMYTVEESTSDVSGLHSKLDRKKSVEKHNEAVQEKFQREFHDNIEAMKNNLLSYRENHIQSLGTLKHSMGSLVNKTVGDIQGFSKSISSVITLVNNHVASLNTSQEKHRDKEKKWVDQLSSFCKQRFDQELSQQNEFQEAFHSQMTSMKAIAEQLDRNLTELQKTFEGKMEDQQAMLQAFFSEHCESLNHIKELGASYTAEQQRALEAHMASVQKTYQVQTEQDKVFAEELKQSFSKALSEMLAKQNNLLKKEVNKLSEEITETCKKTEEFAEALKSDVDSTVMKSRRRFDELERHNEENLKEVEHSCQEIRSRRHELTDCVEKVETDFCQASAATKEAFHSMEDQISVLTKEHVKSAEEQLSSHLDATQSLTSDCTSALNELTSTQMNQTNELVVCIETQQKGLENCSQETALWSDSHSKELENREQSLVHFFNGEMKKDVPTGTTPERRQFSYPYKLVKTKDHELLLQEYHNLLEEGTEVILNDKSAAITKLNDEDVIHNNESNSVHGSHQLDLSSDSAIKTSSLTSLNEMSDLNDKPSSFYNQDKPGCGECNENCKNQLHHSCQ